MPNAQYRLVLDIGTTTIKALIFDAKEQVMGKATALPKKSHPESGWVEQDPVELVFHAKTVITKAVAEAKINPSEITAMGITNQRETIVAWDTINGLPLYPAIVWEDTRTERSCTLLKNHEQRIREKTGLPLIPYFSATKIAWLLDQPAIKESSQKKTLAIGTVDTWILWNLTNEHVYATDYTNASRTLLFNINTLAWDDELCVLFGVDKNLLAQPLPSQSAFGALDEKICGSAIPIRAVCGDQQASHYAAGSAIGTTKATFGTGTFVSQTIGSSFALHEPFFTTLLPHTSNPWYGIEAKINDSGVRMQKILDAHDEKGRIALITELATGVADYLKKLPIKPQELVIDGGITNEKELKDILENMSGVPVHKHALSDGTALGVARLLTS